MQDRAINKGRILAYGLGGIPLGFAGFPLAVTIPQFYGGDLGIDAAVVGFVVLFARITDVITDPVVGIVSDRWNSRLGGRRPFVLLGIPLFILSVWMLFVPGSDVSAIGFGIWIMAIYLGWTLIELPYDAWGAELTKDYQTRTRLMGVKAGFNQFAQILAVGVPFLATISLVASGNREVLQLTAIVLIVLLLTAFIPAFVWLPTYPKTTTEHVTIRQAFNALMGNGAFLRVAALWGLTFIAVTMFTTLALPWMKNALGLTETEAYGLLLAQNLVMLVSIPLWIFIANRTSKHQAVSLTLSVGGVLSLAFYWFITQASDPFWPALLFCTSVGFAAGGFVSVPPAMIPDIADVDNFLVGQPRTGFLYAVMGIILKLAIGIGVALATSFVSSVGFDMSEGVAATHEMREIVSMVVVLVPGAIYLVAALLLWRYPLTEKRLNVVQRAIQRRDGRLAIQSTS